MSTIVRKQHAPGSIAALWLLASTCIALAVATRHSDIARLFMHWLLHPLRPGSTGDTLLLVPAGAAALLAVLALVRHRGFAGGLPDDPLHPRRVLIEARPPDPGAMAAARPGREFAFALRFIRGQPAPSTVTAGPYLLLAATRVPDRTNTAVFLLRTASPLIPPFFTASSTALDRNNFEVHLHLVAAALRAQGIDEFMLMPLLDVHDRERFSPPRRARAEAG